MKKFAKFCEFVGAVTVSFLLIAVVGAGLGVFVGTAYVVLIMLASLV